MLSFILSQNPILIFIEVFFCILFLPKLIYQYYKIWYYKRQGIPFVTQIYPLIGILPRLSKILKENRSNDMPVIDAFREDFGDDKPSVFCNMITYYPYLMVCDPDMLNEMFVTKNKYFDKFFAVRDILSPLMGDSTLFAESTEDWSKRRKSLSATFYKDKLTQMMQLVQQVMEESVEELRENYAKTGKEMDLVSEISRIGQKVILTCAIGEDVSDQLVTCKSNGEITKKPIGYVLRKVFHDLIMRMIFPWIMVFPILHTYFFTKFEREVRDNALELRRVFEELVEKRKIDMKSPDFKDRGDLLSILLNDELFKDNPKMILDECLTFYFAGSQTTSMATQNMFLHMMQQPKLFDEVREDIQKTIIEPYSKQVGGQFKSKNIVNEALNFDNIWDLKKYTYCFMESLRIEPPVKHSSLVCMTETLQIGKYKIKKGDPISIDMYDLHRRKDQWIEPEKFIPERFDPESKFFLTPSGKKRHPMSYMPFFGGKRVCLGKTFAESAAKFIGPNIMMNFDFEYVDKKYMNFKPSNDTLILHEPEVYVRVKEIN